MEPNDSMAAGQGSHGGGPCYGYASHAKGIAPRLWRECVSVAGAAALGAALARAWIVTYHIYLCRRDRSRGARVCHAHVGKYLY